MVGQCPICKEGYKLTKAGVLRKHAQYGTCPGSGRGPVFTAPTPRAYSDAAAARRAAASR
jgi:hypothetical protein